MSQYLAQLLDVRDSLPIFVVVSQSKLYNMPSVTGLINDFQGEMQN